MVDKLNIDISKIFNYKNVGGVSDKVVDYYKNMSLMDAYKQTNFYRRSKKRMNEGLIMTHPLDKSIDILRRAGYAAYAQENPENKGVISNSIILEIEFSDDYEKEIDKLFKKVNNLGYFCSAYANEAYSGKYDKYQVLDALEDGLRYFEFIFEAKYDHEVNFENLKKETDYLFHVTSKKNVASIKKLGLYPRAENKQSTHPERIYMTFSYKAALALEPQLRSHRGEDQVIIVFDINKLRPRTKFYSDVNFFPIGIYTQDNIPPSAIFDIGEFEY